MSSKNVVEFPSRFEAEIELAERSFDLISKRIQGGRPPDETAGSGDVTSLIDAVGELLFLGEREAEGRHISQKKTEKVIARLKSAVGRLAAWPELPRLLATAPLAEAFEEFDLDWLIAALTAALSDQGISDESGSEQAFSALGRIMAVHLRIMMEDGSWAPEMEASLGALRKAVLLDPENEPLSETLTKAVVFHAIRARQALLEQKRQDLAEGEPIPDGFVAALDDFESEVIDSSLARWSLHLIVADILAAGLAPSWAKPRQIVAAAELAVVQEDAPDVSPDLLQFARWARLKPKRLVELRDVVAPVLDWEPAGFEEDAEDRQEQRWRIDSADFRFLPPRWTPGENEPNLPPYSAEAAEDRLEELRRVAWMMIDPVEAVQFVAGVFRFGNDAPEEMDEEVVLETINIWKEDRVVDPDAYEDDDYEDDWGDDLEISPEAGRTPTLVTTDGEPLVSCIGTYEFSKGDRAAIVRRLDETAELERESDEGTDRWVWLEDWQGQKLLIGSVEVEDRILRTETMSVKRSAKIGASLAEHLGELMTMVDLETMRMTPETMARRAAEGRDDGSAWPDVPPEVERDVVQRTLEQHYRRWPDEGVPALGGMTPREAVDDPEGRARVIALLRKMEETNAFAPEPMRSFDFGFLWDDLGLNREKD